MTRALYVIAMTFFSLSAFGDELEQASQRLCEKVKSCAYQEMAGEDLTPEMKAMMEGMLSQMCTQFTPPGIENAMGDKNLHSDAAACMNSMANLSCADFDQADDIETAECKAFEKSLARYQ